jgi:hypothetical protein
MKDNKTKGRKWQRAGQKEQMERRKKGNQGNKRERARQERKNDEH